MITIARRVNTPVSPVSPLVSIATGCRKDAGACIRVSTGAVGGGRQAMLSFPADFVTAKENVIFLGPPAPPLYRVSIRDTLWKVIVSFRHKGLERLYRGGSKRGVQAAHVPKVLRILSVLDVAQSPDDLAIPSFRTHPLKGDLAGHWSIWVNGNWRITFRFNETDVELVDYQDYH